MNSKLKHKNKRLIEQAYGLNEYGLLDSPVKVGNVRISRLIMGRGSGCLYCFPHEHECYNNTFTKNLHDKSWKRYRRHQWKDVNDKSVYERWEDRDITRNGWSNIWRKK